MKITKLKRVNWVAMALASGLVLSGCNAANQATNSQATAYPQATGTIVAEASEGATADNQIDLASFSSDAIAKAATIVDCTLTNGETSKCAQITVKHKPDNLQIGPFCPESLDKTGGIWNWDGEKAGLYRIDRPFLEMLATLGYKFYNDQGEVSITDLSKGAPVDKNSCLSVSADEKVQMTMLVPMKPKMADKPTDLGTVAKVGLALDGVPIFADAPSVLKTGHMPALDPCGGHIDPGGWYHWHATPTDLNSIYDQKKVAAKCGLKQSPTAQFAYAFDGYAMYGTADIDGKVPTDLDACNGHTGPTARNPKGEYHYHATGDFPNLPKCLKGVQAKNNFSTTASRGLGSANGGGGPGGPGGGGPGGRPNFADAAKKLGVTEQALEQAMQDAGGPRADLAQVAKTLNVSEAALKEVLPPPR
jgi:hypothetical protein